MKTFSKCGAIVTYLHGLLLRPIGALIANNY